jgi:hypothetical protein
MDESANGTTDVRVKFGARPNQTMPLSWAESLLTMFCQRDPQAFGRYLAEVATGTEITKVQRVRARS